MGHKTFRLTFVQHDKRSSFTVHIVIWGRACILLSIIHFDYFKLIKATFDLLWFRVINILSGIVIRVVISKFKTLTQKTIHQNITFTVR